MAKTQSVKITPLAAPVDPGRKAMLTPSLAERLAVKVADAVCDRIDAFAGDLPRGATARAREAALGFFDLYEQRPVLDNQGGSGFNDSLWLFALARAIAPDFVVESGVHRGHSTWLLRQACPAAEMHCFDIDLSKRLYIDDMAGYYERDWMRAEVACPAVGQGLVFFDDHISHAQRIEEAAARGFCLALFDDNFPAYNLYATGGPPIPTLAMILDDELEESCEIEWTRNGKVYSCIYNPEDAKGARELIGRYETMPDLAPLTRYSPGSGLSLVRLATCRETGAGSR